jgi:hypothetical protein
VYLFSLDVSQVQHSPWHSQNPNGYRLNSNRKFSLPSPLHRLIPHSLDRDIVIHKAFSTIRISVRHSCTIFGTWALLSRSEEAFFEMQILSQTTLPATGCSIISGSSSSEPTLTLGRGPGEAPDDCSLGECPARVQARVCWRPLDSLVGIYNHPDS